MRITFVLLAGAFVTSALCALDACPVCADWTVDGNPIAATDSVEDVPIIAGDDAGGAYIAWQTHEGDYRSYYITRITASGHLAPGWAPEGLEIAERANDGQIAADGAGGAFLCWIENFSYNSLASIAVCRVTAAGSVAPGWPSGGNAASTIPPAIDAPADPESPHAYGAVCPALVADGVGGTRVAWRYNERHFDYVRMKHLSAEGSARPGSPFGSSTYGYDPRICSDGDGGAFVNCGGVLHHVLSSDALDARWPANGILFPSDPLTCQAAYPCPDGAGGVFVAWLEQGTGGVLQCALQHFTAAGTNAPGGMVLSPYSCQAGGFRDGPYYFDQQYSSIVPDGRGGALIAWQDRRADAGDIYVQRVRGDGSIAPGWTTNGVPACVTAGMQELPMLVGDGAGGAYIVWQDKRRDPDFDIYAQHVFADGRLVPGAASGIPLCTAPRAQTFPQIIEDGAGGAFVTWIDRRHGNADVYASRLGPDGPVATLISFVRADAGGGRVHLEWSSTLSAGTDAELSRHDPAHGWNVLATLHADAAGRFIYDDAAVTGGQSYRYRLSVSLEPGSGYTSEIEVRVPVALEIALERVSPNPSDGDLRIDYSLPDAATARIDVVDVQGRVRVRREVGSSGPGRHSVFLARRGELPAGLYWIRMTHGDVVRSARLAMLR